jgi:molybdopterin molybdotransferase
MSIGFKELITVDKALKEVLRRIRPIGEVEEVPLAQALSRVLAEDVMAEVDVPPFDRSAVDGYAVRAEDTFGATQLNPITLTLRKYPVEDGLGQGEAMEIATGAPLPKGADAVVMYEHSKRVGMSVEIYRPVPPYKNVSRKGEDVRKGEVVAERGRIVSPWDLGVMASLGVLRVKVIRRVRALLINTGNELVELEDLRKEGYENKTVNSSKFVISSLLKLSGVEVSYGGIVPDDERTLSRRIKEGLEGFDMVVTTGGVSVGKRDKTVEAVKSLNPDLLIHGLAIRPGRPTSVAVIGGKAIVMLSGFPVASSVGFEAIIKPIIRRLTGEETLPIPKVRGRLTRRVSAPINVRSYVRVKVYERDGEVLVEPLAVTGSGILSTLTKGNGVLIIPENREGYDEGDEVEVTLLKDVKGS